MEKFLNVSSSPHIRGHVSTKSIMYDVAIALLPAAAFGVYRFGMHSLIILLVSIATALLSEYAYQRLTKQKVTVMDGSALVTGLLLGMNLPPTVPVWIPVLGSIFAVVFVKQFFGGIGQNFMNPALGARCFLLISFTSIMSNYAVDGVSGATPLATLAAGGHVKVLDLFLGTVGGTIGETSALALLIGGVYLLVRNVITWEIPVLYIGSFAIFELILGAQPGNLSFVAAQVFGGGLMLGAIFMATDYVTSPITKKGKLLYGVLLGVLTGILRTYGASAEGVSYAIIISNLLVPLIEKITMPKAFGYAPGALEGKKGISLETYRAAITLAGITLIAGLALGGAYQLTKGPIERAEKEAAKAAYVAVCPDAQSFEDSEKLLAAIESLTGEDGSIAEGKYGNVVFENVYDGLDADGNVIGHVVNVTSKDGFGGEITITVGLNAENAVSGIEFLTINESAGLGMRATEEEFKSQYIQEKPVEEYELVKGSDGGDGCIEALSGATITSAAVTNAINAALQLVNSAVE